MPVLVFTTSSRRRSTAVQTSGPLGDRAQKLCHDVVRRESPHPLAPRAGGAREGVTGRAYVLRPGFG